MNSTVFSGECDVSRDELPAGAMRRIGSLRFHAAHEFLEAAWSPDGRILATAIDDWPLKRYLYLWNPSTGRRIRLDGHEHPVWCIAFNKQGTLLASASSDGTIRLWDPQAGREVRRIVAGNDVAISGLDFSPDGQLIASAGPDEFVCIWDVQTGKRRFRRPAHRKTRTVAFSPDGRMLASAGEDGAIRIWDVVSCKEAFQIPTHAHEVRTLAFSHRGLRLVCGGHDKDDSHSVKMWDLSNGAVLPANRTPLVMNGHTWFVQRVAFSPDDKLIASASGDRTIRIWDAETGKVIHTLTGHADGVSSIAFSPDGKTLVSAGRDHTLRLWKVEDGRELTEHPGHEHRVNALQFSPDGKTLASGSSDGTARLWDPSSGRLLHRFAGHSRRIVSLAFSPEGNRLVTGESGYLRRASVRVWDPTTGNELLAIPGHEDDINGVNYSPNGKRLISASSDETVRIWESENGKLTRKIELPATGDGASFSPNGKLLAIAVGEIDNQRIELWDVAQQQVIRTLFRPLHEPRCFSYSPDGQFLASGGDDHTVRIWEVATGREIHRLGNVNPDRVDPDEKPSELAKLRVAGHHQYVNSLAYSPDGKFLATGGMDCCICLWDTQTGAELLKITGHEGYVLAVAFSPNGKLLASGSADTTILIWDVNSLLNAIPR